VKKDLAAARAWLDRMQAKAPGQPNADYWRARSALHLLEGNLRDAEGAWTIGNDLAGRLPVAGSYQLDRDCYRRLRHAIDAATPPPVPQFENADVAAGVGYFSWRLAKVVGPAGKVYANEIQPGMIEKIKTNMAQRRLENVEPVLGKPDDPMLPKGVIDLALLVDVYHEFAQPQKMLDRVRESLKPGGRLVLIEYRKGKDTLPRQTMHAMTVEEVKAEVEPQGFRLDKVLEILPNQHIIIFKIREN